MQVAGRIIEIAFLRRVHATRIGTVALSLIVLAIALLMLVSGGGVLPVLFVMAYGAGNGILTIVRGAAPAEMYGSEGLGGLLGYLSRASSIARALGPATYPAMVALGLGERASLALLDVLLVAGIVCYVLAIGEAGRRKGLA